MLPIVPFRTCRIRKESYQVTERKASPRLSLKQNKTTKNNQNPIALFTFSNIDEGKRGHKFYQLYIYINHFLKKL